MEKRILVYDNRTEVAKKIIWLCRQNDIAVSVAETEQQLLRWLENPEFHLMLVDVELGGEGWNQGIQRIAKLRKKSRIPLIVITEQTKEIARIMALDAGADDYVTTDCNPLVIFARIQAQIRRYFSLTEERRHHSDVCEVGRLVIDHAMRKVVVDGREVRLTPIEYEILHFLVRQKGRVCAPAQIYESVWNEKPICDDSTIMVHICHIRKKIENDPDHPEYLKTVWGYGYKVG